MKKQYLVTACLIIIFSNAWGQKTGKKELDLSALYLGVGSNWSLGDYNLPVSGTVLLNNNWGFSMSGRKGYLQAREYPADYKDGGWDFLFGRQPTRDVLEMYSLYALWSIPSPTKLLRFGVEAGPSIVTYTTRHFKRNPKYDPKSFLNSDNYITSATSEDALGFEGRVKVELPLFRYIGVECTAYGNLNRLQSAYGVEVNVTFGLVREKAPEVKRMLKKCAGR